jgi:hypothetical protein
MATPLRDALTPCARLECAWLLLLSRHGPDALTPCVRLERAWLLLLSCNPNQHHPGQCPGIQTVSKQHARRTSLATAEASPAHPAPRRNRDRGRYRSTHARSRSPPRAGPSRGHDRSRSPPGRGASPSRHQTDSRQQSYSSKRPRRDKQGFFRAGADSRGEVCATCLGRHEHPFVKCDGHELWDGSPGSIRKSGNGRPVDPNGNPLCLDWQRLKGCQSSSHSERHRCSGCGKSSHGAQACPRAEKA